MCCVLNRRCVTPWLHWMLPKQVSRMVYQPCRMPAPDCTEYHLLTQTTVQSVIEVRCHSIWLENRWLFQYPVWWLYKANQLSSHFLTINCQQNSGTTCLFTCHRTPSVPSSTICLSMGLLEGRSTVTAQLLHYTNQWLKALGGGKDVRFLWLQKSIQFCPSCTTYAVSGG